MRVTRHRMFLDMARAASRRATCWRLNVGAVLVYDSNVVSIGYNGAPAGEPHCSGNGCRYYTPNGCKVVHAEANAFARLSERGLKCAQVYDLYVTHSPCGDCAELPEMGQVRRVVFEIPYRDPSPVARLIQRGVEVYQLLPSEMAINCASGDLCQLS